MALVRKEGTTKDVPYGVPFVFDGTYAWEGYVGLRVRCLRAADWDNEDERDSDTIVFVKANSGATDDSELRRVPREHINLNMHCYWYEHEPD